MKISEYNLFRIKYLLFLLFCISMAMLAPSTVKADEYEEEQSTSISTDLIISTDYHKIDTNSITTYVFIKKGVDVDGVQIIDVGVMIWVNDVLYFDGFMEYQSPISPTELFGAGFNGSTPYVELHWNHDLLNVGFFEVQNSTDKITWDTLGYNATTQYIDYQVVNGTDRYYRVRACKMQPDSWHNSTFIDDFETVYFISGNGAPPIGDEANYLWLIIVLFLGMMGYVVLKVRR